MIQVIYRWEVSPENREAFLSAWEKTTKAIRDATEGARGSFCIVSVERPTEIVTVAKWDELAQWQAFVATAKSESMKSMHALGQQTSHDAYEEVANFTV